MSTLDRRIESSTRGRSPGRVSPAGLAVAVVLAVLLGLWLFGPRESTQVRVPDTGPASSAAGAAPHFETRPPEPRAPGSEGGAPEQAAPLEGSRPPEGWHEVRGVAVRASDEAAAVGATIAAVPHDTVPSSAERWLAARVARDGSFSLWAPPIVDDYRVFLPSSGDGSDGRVAVRMEWSDEQARSGDVRVVLDSGWRLDLVLVDAAGHRCAGVLAEGAHRSARSDSEGRCTLIDLPVGTGPLAVTLRSGPADRITTEAVIDPPPDGSLRKDATLTVP